MITRDRIFYAACALSAVGLLLAAMGFNLALLLFVAAYLLRPALHEFGIARQYADERQVTIHARSGNIAFIIAILAAVGLALWRAARNEPAEDLYTVIAIALAARAITGIVMNGEYRRAGATIIGALGLFAAAFILLEGGFSLVSIIVAAVLLALLLGFAWLSRRFPLAVAIILVLLALGAVAKYGLLEFRTNSLAVWLLFVAPLMIAAACLLLERFGGTEGVTPRTRTMVFSALALAAAAVVTISLTSAALRDGDKPHGMSSGVPTGEMQEIQGIPCTGRLEYYPGGKLKFCTLAREDTLSGQPLAAGTMVHFDEQGFIDWCFLQENTHIQGHFCRGEGHGFQTGFHPNGQLKLAWLVEDEEIDGVPCAKFSFLSDVLGGPSGVYFHEDGTLSSCKLSRTFTIEGRTFEKGDRVQFDSDGRLVAEKLATAAN